MKKLLVLVAINEEMRAVKPLIQEGQVVESPLSKRKGFQGMVGQVPIELHLTAMGMDAALNRALELVDSEKFYGVLMVGFCGGLSPVIRNGDVVIPTKLLSARDDFQFEMDLALVEELGKVILQEGVCYRAVPMTTQAKVIESPIEKQRLFQQTGAEAVDMEAAEVIRVARKNKVKSLIMKVVIDDMSTEVPKINAALEGESSAESLKLTQLLLSQPALTLELRHNMKQASAVLRKILSPTLDYVANYWAHQAANA